MTPRRSSNDMLYQFGKTRHGGKRGLGFYIVTGGKASCCLLLCNDKAVVFAELGQVWAKRLVV